MDVRLDKTAHISLTSSRTRHLLAFACLISALLLINQDLIRAAIRVWSVSPTYSHCFFILPICVYLVFKERDHLLEVPMQAESWPLIFLVPVIAFQLLARTAGIIELQQLALITEVQLLAIAIFGQAIFLQIWFPMLYLFFLVPTGEYLVGPLQNFTAWFIGLGLTVLGVLHHREGTVIELVNGTYRVAEACAGLRFLIATVAIGFLFCYFNYSKPRKWLVFMLAAVAFPVIANGFRALGIVLLAHFTNNTVATGTDHLVYGWGFSVLILGLLMWAGSRFSDDPEDKQEAVQPSGAAANFPVTVLLASLALGIGPAIGAIADSREAPVLSAELTNLPSRLGLQPEQPGSGWSPEFNGSDAKVEFLVPSATGSPPVSVHLFFFAKSRNGKGLITSTNRLFDDEKWHQVASRPRQIDLSGQHIVMQELQIRGPSSTEVIWWTYWNADGFSTSGMKMKLNSIKGLVGGSPASALVAFSTVMDSDEASADSRIAQSLPLLIQAQKALRKTAAISG